MAELKQAMLIYGYIRENIEMIHKDMEIPIDIKKLIQRFFGLIFNSKILTFMEQINFLNLISKDNIPDIGKTKLNLLYRGSEHEFSAAKFHELCDDKGPTFTFICSQFGNVFGGYTNISWRSDDDGVYMKDDKAFLFLIRSNNSDKECEYPKIYKILDAKYAVYHCTEDGPTFGKGSDIFIMDKCDKEGNANEPASYSYDNPTTSNSYDYAGTNLPGGESVFDTIDGQYYFFVTEYEVFQLEKV